MNAQRTSGVCCVFQLMEAVVTTPRGQGYVQNSFVHAFRVNLYLRGMSWDGEDIPGKGSLSLTDPIGRAGRLPLG